MPCDWHLRASGENESTLVRTISSSPFETCCNSDRCIKTRLFVQENIPFHASHATYLSWAKYRKPSRHKHIRTLERQCSIPPTVPFEKNEGKTPYQNMLLRCPRCRGSATENQIDQRNTSAVWIVQGYLSSSRLLDSVKTPSVYSSQGANALHSTSYS